MRQGAGQVSGAPKGCVIKKIAHLIALDRIKGKNSWKELAPSDELGHHDAEIDYVESINVGGCHLSQQRSSVILLRQPVRTAVGEPLRLVKWMRQHVRTFQHSIRITTRQQPVLMTYKTIAYFCSRANMRRPFDLRAGTQDFHPLDGQHAYQLWALRSGC
jgi:hypothetical protein